MSSAAKRARAAIYTEVTGGVCDLSKGTYLFLNTGTNLTISFVNVPVDVKIFDLEVGLYGGALTWPSNVRWMGGTAPSGMSAGKIHMFQFRRPAAYGAPDQWIGTYLLNN